MSQTLDKVGAGPDARKAGFLWLLFGCSAAPLFWLGQLMLGYGVTAYICYPGDHPQTLAQSGPLFVALVAFDIVALAACAAGAAVSWSAWQRTKHEESGQHHHALQIGEGRSRFLALWGLMSSLWFFAAVLFTAIASVTVPTCVL